MDDLNTLETLGGYRRLFTNVALWDPYVRAVCQRHMLASAESIRISVPGTCPVFIVEERWVVKFFGRLFDGEHCFQVEYEAGKLVELDPAIRTARLVASGALSAPGVDWPWPYLIYDYIPGVSIGEVLEQVSCDDKLRAARELGDTVRRLHALPLGSSAAFPASSEPYLTFLRQQRAGATQRHHEWGSLPPHLVDQIDTFLPLVESLINRSRPPHMIHGDLTRDHLLGRFESGHWSSLALIDFGDARTGDLFYELATLHLDLFSGDRCLLRAFLESYGLSTVEWTELPHKAMAAALLHQFNLFGLLPEELRQSTSLEALAESLWQVNGL